MVGQFGAYLTGCNSMSTSAFLHLEGLLIRLPLSPLLCPDLKSFSSAANGRQRREGTHKVTESAYIWIFKVIRQGQVHLKSTIHTNHQILFV